ncbi:hypothetical protein PILCRDRAFT_830474, partial [Piloderma croceum F 1598]
PHLGSDSASALYGLPRCSPDRYRDTSTFIVGSSGSTPPHFAAANGHTNAIRALLSHGAHADRADKRVGGGT